MDDQVAERDPYSDDDLDAILSQVPGRPGPNPRLPFYKSPHRPVGYQLNAAHASLPIPPGPALGGRQNGAHEPSSDYGDFDDEMLDGEIFDAAETPFVPAVIQPKEHYINAGENTPREQWRQERYRNPVQAANLQAPKHVSSRSYEALPTQHQPTAGNVILADPQQSHVNGQFTVSATEVQNHGDPSELHAQIELLLQERQLLQGALERANGEAEKKAGEIEIVRNNASKITQDHDRMTDALQRSHANDAARQRLAVEKMKEEFQKLSTEKTFLENDLAESSKQIKILQKAVKKGGEQSAGHDKGKENAGLTQKRRKNNLADGFSDDEIQPLSPSKLVLRSKTGTPKAGSKRKRKVVEESTAAAPLDLEQPAPAPSFNEQPTEPQIITKEVIVKVRNPRLQHFPFLQNFLNRRICHDRERNIEALARYHLPSQPDKNLSTVLLDKLSPLNLSPDVENLCSAVALQVIAIWSQCIEEKYYEPVHLLVDQVKYILVINPLKTAPDLTNDLMSLLQETADIVIIPRCQKKPPDNDRASVSSADCLELLQLMSSQLSIHRSEIVRFWRTMRFDFLMMLLSFIHPLHELHLTIDTLRTSILPNSFTMIIPPGDGKQDATEARVIDNMTRLLVESPRVKQGEPTLSGEELAELRLSILDVIDEMSAIDYTAIAACRHRLLIGRLVRLMNDSLAHCYNYPTYHTLLISLVNSATRILYYFVINYSEYFNMQQKLSVIPGGEKKFLIVLTRLAFSEGTYLEEGIEDDVVELAHTMLEERVSPEEAEGLVSVMSTAPGNRPTPARRQSPVSPRTESDDSDDDLDV